MIDLERLSRAELAAMAAAGRELIEARRLIGEDCGDIPGSMRGDEAAGEMADWRHYPPGDVYDPVSHAQFFYHRHAPPAPAPEHGHFHTFMRSRGMPPGARPLVMPELAIADAPAPPLDPGSPPAHQPNQGDGNDRFSHLVAIAIDRDGTSPRLFTTNRWVTGETWYAAEDVIAMLDGFSIAPARPVSRWLVALLRLYRPDIGALLRARDAAVMSWRRRHRGKVHVFEDKRLEITSSLAIDPADRLRRLGEMLGLAA